MARIRKTAQEFIQESFSPIIAVLNGPRVENIVSKNNLSFSELLQPFAVFDSEGKFPTRSNDYDKTGQYGKRTYCPAKFSGP